MNTGRENERVETTDTAQRLEKKGKWIDRSFFLNSTTIGMLILKCVILLAIPYAYVWLCGLVLNHWLKLYNLTPFIFYSMLVLAALAIAAVICAVVRFIRYWRD